MNKIHGLTLILTLIITLTIQPAFAKTSLDLGVAGVGARPLGMGKAYVAIADDANAVFTNPAGLGLQKSWALTSMSTKLFGSANYVLAGTAIPLDQGTIGIGYIGLQSPAGYSTVDETSVGEPLSYNSSEIILSYARNLKEVIHSSTLGDLSVGISLKLINHKFDGFDGNAQGMSTDLGIIYKPNQDLSLGANFANLGGKVKWNSGKEEEVESAGKLGCSFKLLDGKLLTSAGIDFAMNAKRPMLLHGGFEYKPIDFLSIRGGLDQDPLSLSESVSNFTAGVGIKIAGVSFDYAYKQDKEIESNARHYFSLSIQDLTSIVMAKKSKDSLIANATAQPEEDNQSTSASEIKEDNENVLEHNRKILNYYQ